MSIFPLQKVAIPLMFCMPCLHRTVLISLRFHMILLFIEFLSGFAGDKLVGEVSRIVVAEACIQALDIEFTEGEIYEINSVEVCL